MNYYKRIKELARLEDFASSQKSEFVYVRGRRRVGKSWLLDDFAKKSPGRFLYSGKADSRKNATLKEFAEKWAAFAQDTGLKDVKTSSLSWTRIFIEIERYAKNIQQSVVIIFDEIQWIARDGSGFSGALKEAWVSWQKSNLVKIIVCGSSNKFFRKKTGGEEKILRGLQTRAHIWVVPLTLFDVKHHCFPKWNDQEVALTYMMIGGIPYYLERIDPDKGFIHALNDAFFTQDENLLDEVSELLDLDFKSTGKKTAEHILSVLGQDGSTQKNIIRKTGLPKGTVSRILEKLIDYEIVFKKFPAYTIPARNQEGIKYYIKDFFLNFFFQILLSLAHSIRNNQKGLVFPYDTNLSNEGYYIPNFSGKAFELLIRYILENERSCASLFFSKLQLRDPRYEVFDYWDARTQIDLIIEHTKDRIARIIECKWAKETASSIDDIVSKKYNSSSHYETKYYIILPAQAGAEFIKKCAEKDLTIITLNDYFSRV